jgi:DNA topoisomerase-2
MELLTNATDRAQNPAFGLSKIDVTVTQTEIIVTNDGKGIPIELDPKHNIYIPEMIFGNMLSGSNFEDGKGRTTGGKNGIGAKAANIFSDKFTVTAVCNGKMYEQSFSNRMSARSEPKITKTSHKDMTKITFQPCLSAFGLTSLHENDTVAMIHKRVIDAAAIVGKKVSVTWNSVKVPVKDFRDYMSLYIGPTTERYIIESGDRWTIGIAPAGSQSTFTQVSFVNGICTEEGGTHVDHVLEPLISGIVKNLSERKEYKDVTIKKQYIKDNMIIFVKSLIEDPTFGSQTKTKHTTSPSKFGSRVAITEADVKKVIKLGITNGLLELAKAKELRDLHKTDGRKRERLTGIPKLDDAHWAGTDKSHLCTLLLTEGDSAKSTALAGLAVTGKEKYGVFPLKGKLLNTRDTSPKKIADNEEISNINKILGLVHGTKYASVKGLRYGKVMLLTDCDTDGSHIKGLLINYLGCFWPELLANGFVCSMMTPLIKAFHRNVTKNFYSIPDYEQWKADTANSDKWRIKYYKGLGTSTAKEAKEYFTDMNLVSYTYGAAKDSLDAKALDLAFKESLKVNTDRRKEWITKTLRDKPKMDYSLRTLSVNEFVNKELVQFSIYDNERSIPNVIDGMKISQRKVLYCCLKRKLFLASDGSGEIKVAQLAGYVSEHSAYHHGEASLHGTIINMAQDYVGSGNNMNLLVPSGQFGSRVLGGKDSASPRYIFTYLQSWVKTVFNEHDNQLLKYLDDDGTPIEPEYYVPTIPMILVNGSEGIGTGWSTTIPPFNPKDIVENLRLLLRDPRAVPKKMHPWYRGFRGTVTQTSTNEWETKGVMGLFKKGKDILVRVSELPVGTVSQAGKKWTQDFKAHLDVLEQRDEILMYKDLSTDDTVNFEVTYRPTDVDGWKQAQFMEHLRLVSAIKTSNMHAFDEKGVIKKYESAEDILVEFFRYRRGFYAKRKEYLVRILTERWELLSEKARFVRMVVEGDLEIFKKPKDVLTEELGAKGFRRIKELLELRVWIFTLEKYNEMMEELEKLGEELRIMKETTTEKMYMDDLDKTAAEFGV